MELIVATSIAVLTACGVYLILRLRAFPVILGMAMLSYAVNVFLFTTGRIVSGQPPLLDTGGPWTDPLPQALVLTAIVISFGMTAVVVMIALGSYLTAGHDRIDLDRDDADDGAPADRTGGPS